MRLLLLALVFQAATASAGAPYVLKFATLAPQGTTWMNILEDWGRQVERQSHGRLTVKFYPGGISGDESDILKKIRFGQLQGAALSGHGFGEIYPSSRILEVPFLFRDHAEIDYVRGRLMPKIVAGFRKNHFELIGWMEVGFIHFFSKEPIASLEELKKRRVWQWQGDRFIGAFFSANEMSPVSLPITEVYTSLSTGLIDTVIATPLSSIALQWFTKTPYMGEIPMANGIGGLLISSTFYGALPADLQSLLRSTGEKASLRLVIETRRDDKKALTVLKDNGVRPMLGWDVVKEEEVLRLRDQALAELVSSGYISAEIVQQVKNDLTQYRSRKKPMVKGPLIK